MIALNKIKRKGRARNEGKEANWGRERNECIGKKEKIGMKGETKKAKGGVGKKYCIRVRGGKKIMRKNV